MKISTGVPQLPKDKIQSCFQIKTQDGTGSCFLDFSNNLSYFVSAKHLLKNSRPSDQIHFRKSNNWTSFRLSEIFFADDPLDIVVFSIEDFLVKLIAKEPSLGRAILGQPLIFLGFPHGTFNTYPGQRGFHTPLAKIGHFSGVIQIEGVKVVVLDGINNPGFSGGPIYSNDDSGNPSIFGVINGYRFEATICGQVFRNTESGPEPMPDYFVRMNSGIIYASSVIQFREIAKRLISGNRYEEINI